ncbi:MAG: TetR/AcrR family transcriptional regulator [Methylococcales bacterium]|nr:TetR/AcrR family transcriptional regulator [Methylococcales bacterium]
MARRSDHSLEELKALVLDAAEALVVEAGFSALNLRQIAMDIGYTVGSVYMVFVNRADLVMHINARTLDAIAANLQAVQASGPPSIEALAKAYLHYVSKNFNRWCMIFDYQSLTDTQIPDWYQAKKHVLFSAFEAYLAMRTPEVPEAYRKQAAWALGCSVHGVCLLTLKDPIDQADLEAAEATVNVLLGHFMQSWPSTAHG